MAREAVPKSASAPSEDRKLLARRWHETVPINDVKVCSRQQDKISVVAQVLRVGEVFNWP